MYLHANPISLILLFFLINSNRSGESTMASVDPVSSPIITGTSACDEAAYSDCCFVTLKDLPVSRIASFGVSSSWITCSLKYPLVALEYLEKFWMYSSALSTSTGICFTVFFAFLVASVSFHFANLIVGSLLRRAAISSLVALSRASADFSVASVVIMICMRVEVYCLPFGTVSSSVISLFH